MRKTITLTAIIISTFMQTSVQASDSKDGWDDLPPRQQMQSSGGGKAASKKQLSQQDQERLNKYKAEKQEHDEKLRIAREEKELAEKQKADAEKALADLNASIEQNKLELQRLNEQKLTDQRLLQESLRAQERIAHENLTMEAESKAELERLKKIVAQRNELTAALKVLEADKLQKDNQVVDEKPPVPPAVQLQVPQNGAVAHNSNNDPVVILDADKPKDNTEVVAVVGAIPDAGKVDEDKLKSNASAAPISAAEKTEEDKLKQKKAEDLKNMQTALSASNPQTNKLGYFGWAYTLINNEVSKLWTSEKDRYAPGTYPPLTFISVLNTMKTKWFVSKSEKELNELSRKDFYYCLTPIHFQSAQHSGGYFVPVGLDCGRFTIETSDPAMRNMIVSAVNATVEEKNRSIYNAYVASLKRAAVKDDMAAFNPIYDDQDASLKPYVFYLTMKEFLETGDNEAFYRDIQFSRRPTHNKHSYTLLTLRLIAFDNKKGHAVHWTLRGYRVDSRLDENSYINFMGVLKTYENDDWLVKSGN